MFDRARTHLETGRFRPAMAALEQVIAHLDHPKRPDTLTEEARADLRSQAKEILAAID